MPMSAIKTYLILNFKSGAYLFEFSFLHHAKALSVKGISLKN